MAEIPYVAKSIAGPPKSSSGKIPYIERPDGSLLADSSSIIETLSRERNVDLDAGLTPDQRAMSLLLQRIFEEELYFLVLYERWVIDENWALTKNGYFGHAPWPVRTLLVPLVRRAVLKTAHAHGVARLPEGLRERKAAADIAAVAQVLGDREFFHGRPSAVDAIAYAFLANAAWAPIRGAARAALEEHTNLAAFIERVRDRWYARATTVA
jgi:glutathione S-transferase